MYVIMTSVILFFSPPEASVGKQHGGDGGGLSCVCQSDETEGSQGLPGRTEKYALFIVRLVHSTT